MKSPSAEERRQYLEAEESLAREDNRPVIDFEELWRWQCAIRHCDDVQQACCYLLELLVVEINRSILARDFLRVGKLKFERTMIETALMNTLYIPLPDGVPALMDSSGKPLHE